MYSAYSWGTHTTSWIDTFFTNCCGVGRAGLLHRRRHVTAVAVQLSHCTVKSNHLSQVWAWKELMRHQCTRGMRNLDPVHAFCFERSGGIYVQRKQWCTDESWGNNIWLVPAEKISILGLFRLACLDMASHQEARPYWNGLIVSKRGVRPSLSASTRSYRMNSCGCVRLSITPCLGSTARAHRWTVSWQT